MKYIIRILFAAIIFFTSNLPLFSQSIQTWQAVLLILGFIFINILPSFKNQNMPSKRHRICANGCELLILFLITLAASTVYMLAKIPMLFTGNMALWLWNLLALIVAEAIIFWNGIIRVYATSVQIGLKWRVIGIACGFIPVANLWALWNIISRAYEEARFESRKFVQNQERAGKQVCKTKYPILLVHGVFFRDFKYFNYWGRIPWELEQNGAVVYYGNHQSAASVKDSARELAERIKEIVSETGCEKVNIIAHSKGGLDCRYALSLLGMGPYVASLTTINTPHRGCVFADYLLSVIPEPAKNTVADGYNRVLKKLGDENPDFIAAVTDLTASACREFNKQAPDVPGVCYESVGSKLNVASGGRFPLNFSHELVKYFDGPNDGLVAEGSFPWGERYQFLTTKGKRGISHGDMIDLNRENIKDFDVREFYVEQAGRLKEKGF